MIILRLILMALCGLVRWAIKPIHGLYLFLTDLIAHLQNLNNELLTKAK